MAPVYTNTCSRLALQGLFELLQLVFRPLSPLGVFNSFFDMDAMKES